MKWLGSLLTGAKWLDAFDEWREVAGSSAET
jgi:hypothetical protein